MNIGIRYGKLECMHCVYAQTGFKVSLTSRPQYRIMILH